jgi:hypothetical protein
MSIENLLDKYNLFLSKGCKRKSKKCKEYEGEPCNECLGKACMRSENKDYVGSIRNDCYKSRLDFQHIQKEYKIKHPYICCVYCANFDDCKTRCPFIDVENKTIYSRR